MANTINLTIQFTVSPANTNAVLAQIQNTLSGLGVKATSAETSVGNLDKEFVRGKSALLTYDDLATKIGFRLQGFTTMFNVLSGSIGSWIRESNTAEQAAAKLTQALQNQGLYSEALVADLKAFATERQIATGIDDDATVAIMGQLTAMGLQGQALRDSTIAVQDLATLMDGDMQGAVRVVADAFSGNTGMLKRYIKGLDETDIKQRGTIAIIEQLQRAIGGQAEALGNTGAGALKKYEAALSDLKQAFGDLLKNTLTPLLSLMQAIVTKVNEGPPAFKTLALGATALGIAFAFINTQLGGLPYIIGGIATILYSLFQSVKTGEGYLYTLGGAVAFLGTAFLVMNAKLIASTIALDGVAMGFRIAGLAAKEFFVSLGPIGWIVLALGATVTAWGLIKRSTDEASESAKRYREEIKQLSETKLNIDIADAILAIADLKARLDTVKKATPEGKIHLSPEVAGLELQLQLQQERLKLLQEEQKRRAQIAEAQRKQAAEEADPKIQLELRELRIKTMQEGMARELALLEVQKEKELQKIDERAKAESLSEKQVNDLKAATVAAYAAERNRILQESYEKERTEREKSANEYYDYAQHLKRLDQDLALDSARTDEEKYNLKRSFLEKEIADLEQLGPRTLEQEKRLAEARIELKKLDNAETLRLERERQDLEQQLRDLRIGDVAEDNRREIEAIREKYARLRELAIKHGEDISVINRAQAAEERNAVRRQIDAAEERWRSENKLAMGAIGSITAGVREASNQWLISHRQAADEMDAIWLAIRNSAIGALTNILATLIENAIVSAAVRAATTAATVASMTAITAAAAPAALAVNIASFGSAGLAAASSTTAAAAALQSSMAAMAVPFAQGGQFEPDQVGFIEGQQYELIAPRRTFEDIMRHEIVPMLVGEARSVAVRNGSDEEWRAVRSELRLLRSELRKKSLSAYIQNVVDDRRIVQNNLLSAQQYWKRKRL
jgi:hypothetical protein